MAFQIDSRTTSLVAQASVVSTPPTSSTGRIVSAPTPQTTDTVKLSLSAHIHQLKSQGQTAKQIAVSLGVAADTVAAYFSAPATKAVAAPTATPSAAGDVDAHAAVAATPAAVAVKVTAPVPAK